MLNSPAPHRRINNNPRTEPLLSFENNPPRTEQKQASTQCSSCPKAFLHINHNVKYILIYSFLFYLASSIFQRDLLSVLVKKISGSDKNVGFISGAQGLTQVVLAVPVGLYGDRFLRQHLIRSGIIVGLIAMAVTCYVFVTLRPDSNLLLFYVGFAVWGGFVVLTNPALESLFADSVETGNRATIFSLKYALLQIASATGPFISVLLFSKLGNTWELPVLRIVLLIGCGIGVVAMSFLLCLKDSKGLGRESEVGRGEQDTNNAQLNCEGDYEGGYNNNNDDDEQQHLRRPSIATSNSSKRESSNTSSIDTDNDDSSSSNTSPPTCCSCLYFKDNNRTVRWTIAVCDVATSTAAGMTVKFFPLFFVSDGEGSLLGYKFSPIQLSYTYLIMPICTVTVAVTLPRMIQKKWCSRPAAMILCKLMGITALYSMVFFDVGCVHPVAMVSLFVFRTAIMNGSAGIKRSILMDAVPKKQRVRWNSLESITRMTWSGSAALGGWCIDAFGYRQTFLITAIVYTVSTTPLLLLLPIVA